MDTTMLAIVISVSVFAIVVIGLCIKLFSLIKTLDAKTAGIKTAHENLHHDVRNIVENITDLLENKIRQLDDDNVSLHERLEIVTAAQMKDEEKIGHIDNTINLITKEPMELLLLTANLGNASIFEKKENYKLPDRHVGIIRKRLETFGADILFVQELKNEAQAHELFPSDTYHVTYKEGGLCTAIRKGILGEPAVQHFPEADKYIHYCQAEIESTGQELHLYNVYNEAPRNDKKKIVRYETMHRLFEHAEKISRDEGSVIIAGDFNIDPEHTSEKIKERWNSFFGIEKKHRLKHVNSGVPTWNFYTVHYELDHVISNLACTGFEVLDRHGRQLNRLETDEKKNETHLDHYGIICKFAIKA